MKEQQEIVDALNHFSVKSKPVLATVVDVQGSSFRLPGAKMLILEDGTAIGTVSGGCLEADVLARADKVRETGETLFVDYDTNDENSVFSLNMGCRGIVRIMMEPAWENPKIELLRKAVESSEGGIIATVVAGENEGEFVALDRAGNEVASTSRGTDLAAAAFEALESQSSKHLETALGETFFDYIEPALNLFIFGASTEAVPLAAFAEQLGWQVTVVDYRPAYATKERFPRARNILVNSKDDLMFGLEFSDNSAAVVMTHNVKTDEQVLSSLLQGDLVYIGQMGPKSRTREMLESMRESGVELEDVSRLHGPVGLDIGATTPEGIALSIVSEIQAVLGKRKGGFLREREGSIYGRK